MMRHMRLAVLVVLISACGAYNFPGERITPSPATGSVSGRVLAVPCSPVEQAGSSCAGRPVQKLEIDYLDGRGTESRTVTDASGNYSIVLEPGAYAVKMKTYMRVISGPLKLDVKPGSNTVANYLLDSGIRVPVQQQ